MSTEKENNVTFTEERIENYQNVLKKYLNVPYMVHAEIHSIDQIIDFNTLHNGYRVSFAIDDVIGLLQENKEEFDENFNRLIVNYHFSSSSDNALEDFKAFIDEFGKDYIIIIDTFVSRKEFPEDKYYLMCGESIIGAVDNIENKKPVPIDETLEREDKILREILNNNILDINKMVDYNYKVPYIYLNDYGKIVAKYYKEKFEKEE